MIDKFLFLLADWHNEILRKRGVITEENYSDKDYVFRSNIWNVFTLLVFILLGLILNILPEISVLFITFNVLRDKCGGWHSYGNLTYCFISSTMIFIAASFICRYIKIGNIFLIIISVICMIYTFIKTPIMIEEEKYQDDWQFKFDYLVLATAFIFAGYFSGYLNCVCVSIILTAFYMSKICKKINMKIRGVVFGL